LGPAENRRRAVLQGDLMSLGNVFWQQEN
jgi:hypothetical protein